VSSQLREALEGHIPVRVGDEVQADSLSRVKQAVRDVDEHLDARLTPMATADGGKELALSVVPTAPMVTPASSANVQRIRVGGNVQAAMVVYAPKPVYPPLAKQARIQGVARFNVIIGKDGTVQDIQAVSGEPLLVEAAIDVVRQWVYKPTWLNGNPVEVSTVVDVNFTLSQ
jgi:protein TonB